MGCVRNQLGLNDVSGGGSAQSDLVRMGICCAWANLEYLYLYSSPNNRIKSNAGFNRGLYVKAYNDTFSCSENVVDAAADKNSAFGSGNTRCQIWETDRRTSLCHDLL